MLVLAALSACGLGLAACGSHAPHTSGIAAAHAPAPQWVPKPQPTWTATQRDDLQRTIATIFSDDITRSATGLAIVAGDGSTLFARRATVPVAPASTLKLVVAASALELLGPNYRFETKLVCDGTPGEPIGTLRGNLWLVGGGDPSLTSDDLRRGVGTLYRDGIRRVDGDLQVDASAFAGPEQNPRWDPDDLTYDYAAGTSAISLDEDTVEFDVNGDTPGGDASVKVVPENESVSWTGHIRTGGSDDEVSIERVADVPGTLTREASNRFVIDGSIPADEPGVYYKPVLNIPGYVGGALTAMFAARGVGVAGGYTLGPAPQNATVLWDHKSARLSDIVHEMLVNSNNHTAETLLRMIGERGTPPGTDRAGIAIERTELARLGVPQTRMTLFDGSGLAPSDRIMPLSLAKLLSAEIRGPNGSLYLRSLPLVGIEGTVKHHDLHMALGRTRAKSGHIENVNGLAGSIDTLHHGRVAFAFVVNDPRANADVVYEEEDRALDALAAY